MRRLGCFGLMLLAAAFGFLFLVAQDWGGRGPSDRPVNLAVTDGASLSTTANRLEELGAIRSARRFKLYARIFGASAPIKAGEYKLPPHLAAADILKVLQGGKTLQRFVTIPEGMPSIMVRERLQAVAELSGAVTVPPEGSVLPDSYAYDRAMTRAALLTRMQEAMDAYLAQAWENRKPDIAVKTPREALILASIVEKETGKPSERRMVAAVYANRLKRGMLLQADPTVIYPITKGKPLGRRILRSELQAHNGYNTYADTGLPAGPICNPGRASIDAVLDPASSGALYFVADGTGGHAFADTLEQHNANVQKWYALRRARGEM
ncbi:MAG: endolytic transglycosylase MltG [Sphingomonas sp.]|nr:endolytic transglycosylase MltG [Sphingomonas sp.]